MESHSEENALGLSQKVFPEEGFRLKHVNRVARLSSCTRLLLLKKKEKKKSVSDYDWDIDNLKCVPTTAKLSLSMLTF